MAPVPAVYVAYTGKINPSGVTPVLTQKQVWAGLVAKVDHAQDFVPAIISTDIITRGEDDLGRSKIVRDVVFKEGNRRVREEVVMLTPTKMVFYQPDGSQVQNIISTGVNGELQLTYDFEWIHKGMSDQELESQREKYTKMSKMAVESSINAIREMVKSGRIST